MFTQASTPMPPPDFVADIVPPPKGPEEWRQMAQDALQKGNVIARAVIGAQSTVDLDKILLPCYGPIFYFPINMVLMVNIIRRR